MGLRQLTKRYDYRIVDVFSAVPLLGNPLAVFADARGLDDATMQAIARELNLSETTFVFPATARGAVAKVRIFTPQIELDFAGHPTIGTAWVLRESGAIPRERLSFELEEAAGPIPVRVEPGERERIWLRAPEVSFGAVLDASAAAAALGVGTESLIADVPCRLLTTGDRAKAFVALRDRAAVDRCAPDAAALRDLFEPLGLPACIFAFAPGGDGAYARYFAPGIGVAEDPATGSATGPLAWFMMKYGLAPKTAGTRLVSEQGTKMGRQSFLDILVHGESGAEGIEVGGYVSPFATATITATAPG